MSKKRAALRSRDNERMPWPPEYFALYAHSERRFGQYFGETWRPESNSKKQPQE